MNEHEKINYVEFPAKDFEATKAFFSTVFGWSFIDYGPGYTAFSNEDIDGGFFQSDLSVTIENGNALIVFIRVLIMVDQNWLKTSAGIKMPRIIYGTAWKKDRTADLVVKAIRTGFRGIDTGCQPKHSSDTLI